VIPDFGQTTRGAEHFVEVEHRLAHAHEHGVVDLRQAAEVQRLVEDLGRGQVTAERHLSRGAERARQRAPGLRREAQGAAAVAVAHEHRLDRMAVGGAEQHLDRSVARLALDLDRERRERDPLRQCLAQRLREVGHRVVAGGATCSPRADLAGAVRGLIQLSECALQEADVHRPTVATRIR
jgi:hypothetical protein